MNYILGKKKKQTIPMNLRQKIFFFSAYKIFKELFVFFLIR